MLSYTHYIYIIHDKYTLLFMYHLFVLSYFLLVVLKSNGECIILKQAFKIIIFYPAIYMFLLN